jgi:hypothetical protein
MYSSQGRNEHWHTQRKFYEGLNEELPGRAGTNNLQYHSPKTPPTHIILAACYNSGMSEQSDKPVRFVPPDFTNGSLELRTGQDGIAIYGTPDGLLKLAELCRRLAESPANSDSDHIHLEDHGLLSESSLSGAVAVFRRPIHDRRP